MVFGIFIYFLLLIGCCYLPMLLLFHDQDERPDVFLAVMLTGVGIAVTGVLVIVLRFMGFGFVSALLILAGTGCYTAWRRKMQCLPTVQRLSITPYNVSVILVCSLYFIHVYIPGFLMGRGTYPALFFNVDSAYYLGQIHAFLQGNAWPPYSLSFLHGSVGYHYGSQAASAFFSRITGVPPHTSAFLLYMPMISLAVLATVLRISTLLTSSRAVRLLTILLLLFSACYPLTDSALILKDFFSGRFDQVKLNVLLSDPQIFNNGYPMLSSRSAIFLTLVVFYCLEQLERPRNLLLATLCTGMIIAYKSPYFIPVGFGFGLWLSFKSLRTKNVKFFLAPVLALAIGITLREISNPAQGFKLIMAFGALFHSIRSCIDITGSAVLLLSIPVLLLFILKRYRVNGSSLYYLFFLIPPFIFVNIVALTRNGNVESGNLMQILALTPVFAAACVSASLRENWWDLSSFQKKAIVLVVALLMLAPFSHKVFQIYRLVSFPGSWHEYVDNDPLAEILMKIKTNDSLIVTNDFRYPAQNFRRDKRQMQIPAIFGHQAYAVNFVYEHYPESEKRLEEQQLFRSAVWNPKLENLAERNGWTHLLIRLAAPHPELIPYTLIGQNSEYQLFDLHDLQR